MKNILPFQGSSVKQTVFFIMRKQFNWVDDSPHYEIMGHQVMNYRKSGKIKQIVCNSIADIN